MSEEVEILKSELNTERGFWLSINCANSASRIQQAIDLIERQEDTIAELKADVASLNATIREMDEDDSRKNDRIAKLEAELSRYKEAASTIARGDIEFPGLRFCDCCLATLSPTDTECPACQANVIRDEEEAHDDE